MMTASISAQEMFSYRRRSEIDLRRSSSIPWAINLVAERSIPVGALFPRQSPSSSGYPGSVPVSPGLNLHSASVGSRPGSRLGSTEGVSSRGGSPSHAAVHRRASNPVDATERLVGLGVQVPEDSGFGIELPQLVSTDSGGSNSGDANYSSVAPSVLQPILEGGAEGGSASLHSSPNHPSPRSALSGSDRSDRPPRSPADSVWPETLRASGVESLREHAGSGRDSSHSLDNGATGRSPRFRRKELRLPQALPQAHVHRTSSANFLRNVSPTSLHEPGNGAYWPAQQRHRDLRQAIHRHHKSSVSASSVLSSSSPPVDRPFSPLRGSDEEGSSIDDAPSARSGSTYELVQWQVATNSNTHLEDIFLPLGAKGDGQVGHQRSPLMSATPLKLPASPKGLRSPGDPGNHLNAAAPGSSEQTGEPLTGLGLGVVDSQDRAVLDGMPGWTGREEMGLEPQQKVPLPSERAAALERIVQELEVDSTHGSGAEAKPEQGPSALARQEDKSFETIVARNERSVPDSATIRREIARNGSLPGINNRTSSLQLSRGVGRPLSDPAEAGLAAAVRKEPLTGLIDHRYPTEPAGSQPKRETDSGAGQIATRGDPEPRASRIPAPRLFDGVGAFVTLTTFVVIWQGLFFVFPAPYIWSALQPALVAIAAVLFSLGDVTTLLLGLLLRLRGSQELGDSVKLLVEVTWSLLGCIAVAYGTSLCVVQLVRMTRSSDLGAGAPGIHLDRARDASGNAFQQVLRDVPLTAVLFLSGCLFLAAVSICAVRAWWTAKRKSRSDAAHRQA